MKKVLLLLLVLLGGVMNVNATTRVYIKANGWADASARFKMNIFKSGNYQYDTEMTHLRNDVYYIDIDDTKYDAFQLCRMNSDYSSQWNYTANKSIESTTKLYIMGAVSNGYNSWDASDFLPNKYYFVSDKSGSWVKVAEMTESTGTYSYTFTASDYSGKYFAWCTGEALSSAGAIVYWKGVFASSGAGGSDQDMGFLNISYPSMYPDQNGKRWRVLSGLVSAGASIKISYTPSTNSAVVSAYRTTTIGSTGYATWSNAEKYEIANTNVTDVYTVDQNNTSTVRLNSVKGSTFAAGTGVILKGSGIVTINAVASDAETTDLGTNYLVGSGNSTASVTAGKGIYTFSWDGSNTSSVGFYLANSGTLGAHKAYLDISSTLASTSREFLGFSFDETTGIAAVEKTDNTDNAENKVVYNLNGQRVMSPSKGLYIVNGKKVIIK